jgi:hypothetical protein
MRAWIVALAAATAVAVSAWAAVETGEGDDERVERVVPEARVSAHEEMGERFFAAAIVVAVVAGAGLAPGLLARVARIATAAGSIMLAVGVVPVGHSGGELVYRYGAADAYAPGVARSASSTVRPPRPKPGDEGDRH